MILSCEPPSLLGLYPPLAKFLEDYPCPQDLDCLLTVRENLFPEGLSIALTLRDPARGQVMPVPIIPAQDLNGNWERTKKRLEEFIEFGLRTFRH
jgi:hypothetical protein